MPRNNDNPYTLFEQTFKENQERQLELKQLEESVSDAQVLLRQQEEQRRQTRASLLRQERSRCGLELELYNVQDQYKISQAELETLLREVESKKTLLQRRQAEVEHVHTTVYAPHLTTIAVYQQQAQAKLDVVEETKRVRLEKLQELQQSARTNHEQTLYLKQKVTETRDDIQKQLREEQERDELSEQLDKEIKAAIAKRTLRRHALQDAKDSLQQAEEEALKWEQECVDLAAAGSSRGNH